MVDPARQFLGVSKRDIVQTAAAEQFCGVPNCSLWFPATGDNCKSDGAAATGLGFLTAAAAVAAAL